MNFKFQKGLTLIEVVIACVILAITISTMLTSFPPLYNFVLNGSNQFNNVFLTAFSVLEEERFKDYSEIKAGTEMLVLNEITLEKKTTLLKFNSSKELVLAEHPATSMIKKIEVTPLAGPAIEKYGQTLTAYVAKLSPDITGEGTVDNPYIIYTLTGLDYMRLNPSAHYELANDINASPTLAWNEGAGWEPIGNATNPFIGSFDGKGYAILSLYINRPEESNLGLFGVCQDLALVKNVAVVNASVTGNQFVSTLVGRFLEGSIEKCYSSGEVFGNSYVGGLVGENQSFPLNISDSYSLATITSAGPNSGGIIGYLANGIVQNSFSAGQVLASLNSGGLIGTLGTSGSVLNSYWDMETSGQATSAGGEGKTTAQMQQQATYNGWDFINTWQIGEGISYPTLLFF